MLNARQRRFIDEYLIDLNATQAAIRAGYSEKTARQIGDRLLTNVDIRTAIDAQLEQIHNEKTADAQEVLEYLTSVMRGEMTDETLRFIGEGFQEKTTIAVSAKDRLKAAELIGKRYSLFADKLNLDGAIPVIISGADSLED